MRIEADFDKISTEYENLPEDVYRGKIDDIEEGETRENKLPMLTFTLEVTEGDLAGRKIKDYVTLKNRDGKRNDIGLGRLKAYNIAVNGEEAGNGTSVDTDTLKGGTVLFHVKHEAGKADPASKEPPKTFAKVSKVLPPG